MFVLFVVIIVPKLLETITAASNISFLNAEAIVSLAPNKTFASQELRGRDVSKYPPFITMLFIKLHIIFVCVSVFSFLIASINFSLSLPPTSYRSLIINGQYLIGTGVALTACNSSFIFCRIT